MTLAERFARWMTRRYGYHGRPKPIWAWLVECVLFRARPFQRQRWMFLGPPPAGPDWSQPLS